MAKAEANVVVEETPVAAPVQSRSRMLILLAFSGVVLLQAIFLALILRSLAPAPEIGSIDSQKPIIAPEIPQRNLDDLIEFPITTPNDPIVSLVTAEDGTGFMVSARFTLKIEKTKQTRFSNLYDKVKSEIRGEILTILCSSKIADFTDPNRTVIKSRILRKINEIFAEPQPLVKEVIVESFNATPL